MKTLLAFLVLTACAQAQLSKGTGPLSTRKATPTRGSSSSAARATPSATPSASKTTSTPVKSLPSTVSNQTVLAEIKQRAARDWPGDYHMQAFAIQKQSEGYNELRLIETKGMSGIPASVLSGILSKCAADWGTDYHMRVYAIKKQANAWAGLTR